MLQFNQIIFDIDILINKSRSCWWVGNYEGLRTYKLKKNWLEKMLDEQIYREATWYCESENENIANIRFFSLDLPFWFSCIPYDFSLTF